MYFFQFLSSMHAKVAISNPTNYIFLRMAINTLSFELIKRNWAVMPTVNQTVQ